MTFQTLNETISGRTPLRFKKSSIGELKINF